MMDVWGKCVGLGEQKMLDAIKHNESQRKPNKKLRVGTEAARRLNKAAKRSIKVHGQGDGVCWNIVLGVSVRTSKNPCTHGKALFNVKEMSTLIKGYCKSDFMCSL